MLEINPEDPVAGLCVQAAAEGVPLARPIPLRLALPAELEASQRRVIETGEGDVVVTSITLTVPSDGTMIVVK